MQHNKQELRENFIKSKALQIMLGKSRVNEIPPNLDADNLSKDFIIDFDENTLQKL